MCGGDNFFHFLKTDHDLFRDDCWPTMTSSNMGNFTFYQGQALFREQNPMGWDKTYRTIRWGKDLQIWLAEGRDYRSPNYLSDGPKKTLWGNEQLNWFRQSVKESDATFKVLISPTPIVGPDRKNTETITPHHFRMKGSNCVTLSPLKD
uniref:PhoD-like phosphatase metallophosphatase domain-containing protein n=1 Tax=Trieres chinensis TaxID=1514140 RepID=A0A6U1T1C2_TRICV|mmetsp:Transcript_11619/g.24225  ORF Transcript_11619/g.24225 Transcript_11619/m.24225 type:complete len:149 (+) Transcript_11619:217-663(+)